MVRAGAAVYSGVEEEDLELHRSVNNVNKNKSHIIKDNRTRTNVLQKTGFTLTCEPPFDYYLLYLPLIYALIILLGNQLSTPSAKKSHQHRHGHHGV